MDMTEKCVAHSIVQYNVISVLCMVVYYSLYDNIVFYSSVIHNTIYTVVYYNI